MQSFDSYLKSEVSPHGIGSFELAKDLSKSSSIIDKWQENEAITAAGLSTGFDFLFIIVYVSFISFLIFLVSKQWKNKLVNKISNILIWAIVFAGLLDVTENYSMIKLLLGNFNQLWSSIAFYAAFAKFSIILLGIVYILINGVIYVIKSFTR